MGPKEQRVIIPSSVPKFNDVDQEFAHQVAEFIDTYRPALAKIAHAE
jgi:hypothetical protein